MVVLKVLKNNRYLFVRRLNKAIGIIMICCVIVLNAAAGSGKPPFILDGNVIIYTAAKPGDPLFRAVTALQRDLAKVLGGKSFVKSLADIGKPGIVIVNSKKNKLIKPLFGWEAHRVYVKQIKDRQQVILQGSDILGAIYAIYTFSEKVLGVPPLWFYCGWTPQKRQRITISDTLDIKYNPPYVKYRAWFPNDMDLLSPWRKLSEENNEIWLETALRLKFNVIQSDGRNFSEKYAVSPTMKLISSYGLIISSSHTAPLAASLQGWDGYWEKIKHTDPPKLLLANESSLEEYWRYCIECIIKNNINMLWEIGFRGAGDHPFWYSFKDAPVSMKDRAEVINRMMKKERNLLIEITGNPQVETNAIFYNEMSDLLAMGYINPPSDSNFIWTFVAARRDHYPNKDIQNLDPKKNLDLGYYLNMQFNSTGSHLAEGEGPWKMERNFRYVDSKSGHPLKYSIINVGNIREFILSISANAKMMWNFDSYDTDDFLRRYCALYFGKDNSERIAHLYHDYFYAYWRPRRSDLPGFDRQYIFQDLRYKQAIKNIISIFENKYDPNPLKDYGSEQVKGRTYRIVPQDNGAKNQVDAILNGTKKSANDFLKVVKSCDRIYGKLEGSRKMFFNDNLRAPAYFMYYLNETLLRLCQAYQLPDTDTQKDNLLKESAASLRNAEKALKSKAHGHFKKWYAGDRIFDMQGLLNSLTELEKKL